MKQYKLSVFTIGSPIEHAFYIEFQSRHLLVQKFLYNRNLTRSLHRSTVRGFPYSARRQSLMSSIWEFTSLVGRPSCLRQGSMEWANLFRLYRPFQRTMVYWATAPPVANSCSQKLANNSSHYSLVLFVKKRQQCPLSSSETLYEFFLYEVSSLVPRATPMTLFFPMRNFESGSDSLSFLKLLVLMFSKLREQRYLQLSR